MFWPLVGYFFLSFIMASMIAQLYPDGRFPLHTVLLVALIGTAGAWAGDLYIARGIVTGALIGTSLVSSLLLFLLHRIGLLVDEPWSEEPEQKKEKRPE